MNYSEAVEVLSAIQKAEKEMEEKTRRQQDRIQTLIQAKRLHNPFAVPRLAKTEFPAVELGRRESKCSRAFAVVASCR